jgi:hypothetical protein
MTHAIEQDCVAVIVIPGDVVLESSENVTHGRVTFRIH